MVKLRMTKKQKQLSKNYVKRLVVVKLATPEEMTVSKATRAAYGVTLAELAQEGVKVVAVDADLTGSTTTKALLKLLLKTRGGSLTLVLLNRI